MVECQYDDEPFTIYYVGEKNKEDVKKNIVISIVDMVIDDETTHGLDWDSKVHGHVEGVGRIIVGL